MTQKERILKLLEDAGKGGITGTELYEAYLPRAAARIHELKAEGHRITPSPENGTVRYVLERGTGSPRVAAGNSPQGERSSETTTDTAGGLNTPTGVPAVSETSKLGASPVPTPQQSSPASPSSLEAGELLSLFPDSRIENAYVDPDQRDAA